jgi:hypothetical protein
VLKIPLSGYGRLYSLWLTTMWLTMAAPILVDAAVAVHELGH